jgi:hypothetical protein
VVAALLATGQVYRGFFAMLMEGILHALPLGCICYAGLLASLPVSGTGKGAIPAGRIPPWSLRLGAWFLLAALAYNFDYSPDGIDTETRWGKAAARSAPAELP